MENKATRATKVPAKTKKVDPPEVLKEEPTNNYAPKQKIGGPVIGQEKVTHVGLGGLKVTTNGRDNY